MFTSSVFAVTGALLSVVAAVPMVEPHHHLHHKRDYVWVTKTQEEVVTVPVTKTVWIEPGETPPAGSPQGYSPPASSSTPDVQPAATSEPAPAYTPPASSSSDTPSVYVPPTTSSTSVYVAPTPTTPTSTYVPPPATTYVAPTTSAAAAYSAPAASSDSGSSSSGASGLSYGMAKAGTSFSGDLTWYQVGLGACGITSTSDQHIVAISETIFDAYSTGNPNTNPLCGKYVTITGANGEPYQAQIVDRCTGCAEADLDCSEGFFNKVTNYGDGRVHNMKWSFD